MKTMTTKLISATLVFIMLVNPCIVIASPIAPTPPNPPVNPEIQPTPPTPPQTNQTNEQSQPNSDPAACDLISSTTATNLPESSVGPNISASNNNESQPQAVNGGGEASITNTNTGANSENDTTKNDQNSATISNDNDSNLENNVIAESSSGNNKSNFNTGNGSVTSGDSNLVLNILNMINTNIVALPGGSIVFLFKNIFSDLIGNYIIDPLTNEAYDLNGSRVDIKNENTGAGSQNNASSDNGSSTEVTNNNAAGVTNNYTLTSSSGNNKSNDNTGNGSVVTGDANLSFSLLNFINTNLTVAGASLMGVINIFGNWVGNLVIPQGLIGNASTSTQNSISVSNNNTGSNSENQAGADAQKTLEVKNDNQGTVANNITVKSETGDNKSSYNTGSGSVVAGNSDAALRVENEINRNIFSSGTVFYILVNVLGNWTGANLLPINLLSLGGNVADSQTNISNENTGANSSNNAQSDQSTETKVENNNNALLTNNISATTQTGGNEASYNTGNGSIKTGDAKTAVNVINWVNTNITANRIVFLILNVFGDWTGNITDKQTQTQNGTASTESSGSQTITETTENGFVQIITNIFHTKTKIEKSGENIDVTVENNPGQTNPNYMVFGTTNEKDGGNNTGAVSGSSNSFMKYIRYILYALFIFYCGALIAYWELKKKNIQRRQI